MCFNMSSIEWQCTVGGRCLGHQSLDNMLLQLVCSKLKGHNGDRCFLMTEVSSLTTFSIFFFLLQNGEKKNLTSDNYFCNNININSCSIILPIISINNNNNNKYFIYQPESIPLQFMFKRIPQSMKTCQNDCN